MCNEGILGLFGFFEYCWGPFILLLLSCFIICMFKAIKAATDTESDTAHLSGLSVITLEGKRLQDTTFALFLRQTFNIDYFQFIQCRVILFTDIFFLKKWLPHV